MLTIEQARDRVAELTGKPAPLTLDAVAALWPKGWALGVAKNAVATHASGWTDDRATGTFFSEHVCPTDSANHELHARLLLLVAVLEHIEREKANDPA